MIKIPEKPSYLIPLMQQSCSLIRNIAQSDLQSGILKKGWSQYRGIHNRAKRLMVDKKSTQYDVTMMY